jgi:hypothetical protein
VADPLGVNEAQGKKLTFKVTDNGTVDRTFETNMGR